MDFETIDRCSHVAGQLECSAAMLFILWEALEGNAFAASVYAPAALGIHEYLSRVIEELKEVIEARQEVPPNPGESPSEAASIQESSHETDDCPHGTHPSA